MKHPAQSENHFPEKNTSYFSCLLVIFWILLIYPDLVGSNFSGACTSWRKNILNKAAKAEVFSFRMSESSSDWRFIWELVWHFRKLFCDFKDWDAWFLGPKMISLLPISLTNSAYLSYFEDGQHSPKNCWSVLPESLRFSLIQLTLRRLFLEWGQLYVYILASTSL